MQVMITARELSSFISSTTHYLLLPTETARDEDHHLVSTGTMVKGRKELGFF